MRKISIICITFCMALNVFSQEVQVNHLWEKVYEPSCLFMDGTARSMTIIGNKLYILERESSQTSSTIWVYDLDSKEETSLTTIPSSLCGINSTADGKIIVSNFPSATKTIACIDNQSGDVLKKILDNEALKDLGRADYIGVYGNFSENCVLFVPSCTSDNVAIITLQNGNVIEKKVMNCKLTAGDATSAVAVGLSETQFFVQGAGTPVKLWTEDAAEGESFPEGVITGTGSGMAVATVGSRKLLFNTLNAEGGFEVIDFTDGIANAKNIAKQTNKVPGTTTDGSKKTSIAVRVINNTEIEVYQFVPTRGVDAYKVILPASKPDISTNVENSELRSNVYSDNATLFVESEVGDLINVYTVDGCNVYSAVAESNLTSINVNANMVIVRINDECHKMIMK